MTARSECCSKGTKSPEGSNPNQKKEEKKRRISRERWSGTHDSRCEEKNALDFVKATRTRKKLFFPEGVVKGGGDSRKEKNRRQKDF